jgi:hypothetical protein
LIKKHVNARGPWELDYYQGRRLMSGGYEKEKNKQTVWESLMSPLNINWASYRPYSPALAIVRFLTSKLQGICPIFVPPITPRLQTHSPVIASSFLQFLPRFRRIVANSHSKATAVTNRTPHHDTSIFGLVH